MKSFAIQEKNKDKNYRIRSISIWFGGILIVLFAVIVFFARVNMRMTQKNKIDLFAQNLQEIAFYFWAIDNDIAKMLVMLDDLAVKYQNWENILVTQSEQIDTLMQYVNKNNEYLYNLGFKKYAFLIDLISKVWYEKEEIKDLLGATQPYNYLVILQNTNEKRPNGGFFWSFAFVTFDKGRITNLEIIDSYYPDYFAPNARIPLKDWEKNLFPLAKKGIGFIAGNKFGFTDLDGENLKKLYEMSFNTHYDKKKLNTLIMPEKQKLLLHKYIKGVIFVRLDLFTKYFPQLEKLSQEWQFVNANIDLIRGEVKSNKKEKYIKEANLFFRDNRKKIFKAVINNLEEIIHDRWIHIYLSNVSSWLVKILEHNNLMTTFQPNTIYARDINIAQNKSDAFVDKYLEIVDMEWHVIDSVHDDIISIEQLPKWSYRLKIYYHFNLPSAYVKYMSFLEKQYHITMTDREKSILSLVPHVQDWKEFLWATQWMVYFPKDISLKNIYGVDDRTTIVNTPVSIVQKYTSYITQENQTKIIEIVFEKR